MSSQIFNKAMLGTRQKPAIEYEWMIPLPKCTAVAGRLLTLDADEVNLRLHQAEGWEPFVCVYLCRAGVPLRYDVNVKVGLEFVDEVDGSWVG